MGSGSASPSARPPLAWPGQIAVLIAVWAVLVAIVVGVGKLITGPLESTIDPPENDLARWFVGERTSGRSQLADVATFLGDTYTVLGLGLVTALGVWLWRREGRPVLFVLTTLVGAVALYLVTVSVDPRPRPPVKILDPGLDPTHSFPSGHVGASIAAYGVIVVLVWVYARRARWWVTPLLLVPPLIALARLYEGAHHLSDVLASVVYASVWLVTTTIVCLSSRASPTPPTRPGRD